MFSRNFFASIKDRITASNYFNPDDFEFLDNDKARDIITSDLSNFFTTKLNGLERALKENAFFVIQYRYQKEFHFSAMVDFEANDNNEHNDYFFSVFISPGKYMAIANESEVKGHEQLADYTTTWLRYLKVELREMRSTRQQTEFMEEILEKVQGESLDEFFTKEEANELRRKLDERISEIEKMLNKEEASKTTLEQQELKKQLANMKRDLLVLQEQVTILSKKNWTHALLIRYKSWSPNSLAKLSLKNGMQSVIGLLTEGLTNETTETSNTNG